PTQTIPQGISALLAFHPDRNLQENKDMMDNAKMQVKSGQVTYAVRDTTIDGMTIEKGHFMGIADGKIKATHQDKMETARALLADMITEDDELLTILQGEETSDSEVKKLVDHVEITYADVEVEIRRGNHPSDAHIFFVEYPKRWHGTIAFVS